MNLFLLRTARKILGKYFGIGVFKANQFLLKKFLDKIFIYDCGYNLIRIGPNSDGGYLVPNILDKISYCFSPGVGKLTKFEDHLLKYKIKSFLADGQVNNPSSKKTKYNFLKKNISSFNNSNNITINKWIKNNIKKSNKDFILQMDIEGSEIAVLNNIDEKNLKKFKIIIIEFHNFDYLGTKLGIKIYDDIFSKLLNNFTICHIHPNNCSDYCYIGKYKIPKVMEFTFLNSQLVKSKKLINKKLPHPLDFKNVENKKDISVPEIFYKT